SSSEITSWCKREHKPVSLSREACGKTQVMRLPSRVELTKRFLFTDSRDARKHSTWDGESLAWWSSNDRPQPEIAALAYHVIAKGPAYPFYAARLPAKSLRRLARPEGFEPPAPRFVV